MKRYQIRVPKNFAVENVIEEMASKGWDSIINDLDAERILVPLKNYRHFQTTMYLAVNSCLRKFILCGMPEFCTDKICMCRLDTRPKPTANNGDQIYLLFLNSNLEEFLDDIVHKGFETLETILKAGRKHTVISKLEETFRAVLAGYLYFNPICGSTPFCEFSETVSVAAYSKNTMPIWQ